MSKLTIPVNADDHIQGEAQAPVTLVEYGDYECPSCGRAYPVVRRLQQKFGDKLRFVFRHFPLCEAHPHAESAAEAAEFAASYHRFWEMHELLFTHQRNLLIPELVELAKQLELPAELLSDAITNRIYKEKLKKDFMGGVRSGVYGTPGFFINEQLYRGGTDYDSLASAIRAKLQGLPGT